MAYRRRTRRPRVRKSKKATRALKRSSPQLYKAVKQIARKQALAIQETKYVSTFTPYPVTSITNVWNQLNTKVINGTYNYLQTAMPPLTSGTTGANVIGQKTILVNGYTRFHFAFTAGAAPYNQDIIIKLFLLNSRQAKSNTLAIAGLPGADLLRANGSAFVDFDPYSGGPPGIDPLHLAQMPLNTLAWTGKCHTFRLCKNTGMTSFNATTPTLPGDVPNLNSSHNYHDFVWNWTDGKKNQVLNYDGNFSVPGYPSNYCPLYGVVAYYPDGNPVASTAVQLPVNMTISNHMWYKDG